MVVWFREPICLQVLAGLSEPLYHKKGQRDVQILLTSGDPMLVNTYKGIQYSMTQLFKNIVTICVGMLWAV